MRDESEGFPETLDIQAKLTSVRACDKFRAAERATPLADQIQRDVRSGASASVMTVRRARERSEKNISAEQRAQEADPRFPGSHGNAGRTAGTKSSTGERAEATCGHDAAEASPPVRSRRATRVAVEFENVRIFYGFSEGSAEGGPGTSS